MVDSCGHEIPQHFQVKVTYSLPYVRMFTCTLLTQVRLKMNSACAKLLAGCDEALATR